MSSRASTYFSGNCVVIFNFYGANLGSSCRELKGQMQSYAAVVRRVDDSVVSNVPITPFYNIQCNGWLVFDLLRLWVTLMV